MRLQKLSAALMAAVLVTTTPAGAFLGQMTSYAKSSDDDDEKDYTVSDAAWEEEEDTNGKMHVYATWTESDNSASATISIYVDDKKRDTVSTKTNKGRVEVTQKIKSINKKGTYTFKITSSKKSTGEDEKSSSESDTLEIDSDYLKKLASSNSSSSAVSSSSSGTAVPATGASPADAMKAASAASNNTAAASTPANSAAGQSAAAATQTSPWQNWSPYGWVYFKDGQLVKNDWVVDNGKFYHINSTGFMDVNTWVTDATYGTHYVGADGALVQ